MRKLLLAAGLVFSLFGAPAFASDSVHLDDCQAVLHGAEIIRISVGSDLETDATYRRTLDAILNIAEISGGNAHIKTALLTTFGDIRRALYGLYKFEQKPLKKEAYQKIRKIFEDDLGGSTNDHYLKAFGGDDGVSLYGQYFSRMQNYFSALVVGYGVMRAGFYPYQTLNVLELGSGIGDTTKVIRKLLPAAKTSVVDVFPKFVDYMEKHKGTYGVENVYNHDFTHGLPAEVANESVDLIVSISAASQYLDLAQFKRLLGDVYRALKPGGYIVFDYGPHALKDKGAKMPLYEFLEHIRRTGLFETEDRILLAMRSHRNNNLYYPVVLRKRSF